MDLGTVLSATQTLFAALQCAELKEVCSILGYELELEKLKNTVTIVKAVLRDADSKQSEGDLLSQAQIYIDELKYAVYDAEDLLDEFSTLARQKKLIKGGKLSKKVRVLFSRFNPLATAHKMSKGVKQIRKRLDDIANEHIKFGFKLEFQPKLKLDCQPTRRRILETCSYIGRQDFIGREDDVENIVGRLLNQDVERNVSCLAIVGIGGLGKTALAQKVYNDPRIEKEFLLRSWACISDQDPKNLDVRATLCKILDSATGGNHEKLQMEVLQKEFREQLGGKKFFIVLDDVWIEDRYQWLELENFLISGLKGSCIVVTTRSEITATVVGDKYMHKLKGLSKENSQRLFEMTAFGHTNEEAYPSDLVEIGYGIVQRCANVPLAIRVVGSLLYGHGKEKWLSFQNIGLGRLKSGGNVGIESILKLSYHNLDSPLKTCFSYCALFPKDHVIEKDILINLWMAQDYIVPLQEGQSVEEAGEEYFSIFVKRCFFQDVKKDEYDNIISCKIHDLMHDVAQEVGGMEIYATNDFTTNLDNTTRHLSYLSSGEGTNIKSKIRTFLCVGWSKKHIPLDILLKNWTCLRALDLSDLGIESLPCALGNLLHLRYLDLSRNHMLELLPDSVTNLHNLQTLNLNDCGCLKELPEHLSVLVNLRVLGIGLGCPQLNGMPFGLGKLSCLQKLPLFLVGDRKPTLKKCIVDQMEDLKALTNLKGSLYIKILENSEYLVENIREEGYIKSKQYLSRVNIWFPYKSTTMNLQLLSQESQLQYCMPAHQEELLLENLQPHGNIKELKLNWYVGMRMPGWAMEDNLAVFLPNLVRIGLYQCVRLEYLPSLRKLCYLKFLSVEGMVELEYMENTTSMGIHSNDDVRAFESNIYFPSLEELILKKLPKLRGWWKDDEIINSGSKLKGTSTLPSFHCLSTLIIWDCPNLTCIPTSPTVEKLYFIGELNKKLRIMTSLESRNSKLRSVCTHNTGLLKSALPVEAFQCLRKMNISFDMEIESLSEVEEVFQSFSYSLRELIIKNCDRLKWACRGLKHLIALETLELYNLPNLNLSNTQEREEQGEEDDGMPWCFLYKLHSLRIQSLPVVNLPKGLRYLTALRSLDIWFCDELVSLPESLQELSSLKTLTIRGYSGLWEDWPNIRHIPDIRIY